MKVSYVKGMLLPYREIELLVSLDADNFQSETAKSEVLLFRLLAAILHPEDIHIIIMGVFVVVFEPSDKVDSFGSAVV